MDHGEGLFGAGGVASQWYSVLVGLPGKVRVDSSSRICRAPGHRSDWGVTVSAINRRRSIRPWPLWCCWVKLRSRSSAGGCPSRQRNIAGLSRRRMAAFNLGWDNVLNYAQI